MRVVLMFGLVLFGLLMMSSQEPVGNVLETKLVQQYLSRLTTEFGYQETDQLLLVSAKHQQLYLVINNRIVKTYAVSTSYKGVGAKAGSDQTPPGIHIVDEKFGAGAASGTIFVGRQSQGKVAAVVSEPKDMPEDYVTSRILWLKGLEPGINSGPGVDSKKRYIYIHGTQEEGLIGKPASHGCVRMYNKDVIELFEQVETGCYVVILNDE